MIGFALISAMFALVKYLSETGMATAEMMFWRQLVTVPVVFGWLWSTGKLHLLRTSRMSSHAVRAMIGMTCMALTFVTAIMLPLAEATTLGFTTPVFAAIVAGLVWREKVGPWRWSAVLIGFGGVLIIFQPGSHAVVPLGVAAGLLSSLLVAIVSFQIKDLARTDHPVACVFYFALFGSLAMALTLPFTMTSHSPVQWLTLLAIGAIGMMGQLFLTLALKYGAVATVIVMDYSALIWAMLFGYLFWDQLPLPTTWIGAPVVIAAGMIVIWREHVHARSLSPRTAQELE